MLLTRAPLFKPTFPASKERMLGREAIFFHQGSYHSKLRKLVLKAFLPESIKPKVSSIESIALRALHSWDGRAVNTYQEMKSVSTTSSNSSIVSSSSPLLKTDASRVT